MRLVRIIRDETHRFAVSFHRQRRATRDFTSELTSIPGVGEKLKERLLRNFGSMKRVSEATVAELKPFVGQKQAEMIVEHFKERNEVEKIAILNPGAIPSKLAIAREKRFERAQ